MIYVEGIVSQILNNTKQYTVQISGSSETRTVMRPHMRLLRAPWYEELNDFRKLQQQQQQASTLPQSMPSAIVTSATTIVNSGGAFATSTPIKYHSPNDTNIRGIVINPSKGHSHHLQPQQHSLNPHHGETTTSAIIYTATGTPLSRNDGKAPRVAYNIHKYEPGTPLQLHHVLPTLQVSSV